MSFTNFLEDKVLKHVFTNTAYSQPATVYVGLFTAAPGETGGGTEVAGNSYARQSCSFSVSGTAPTLATNGSAVEFPTASGSWGTITHIAVFDADTSGNMLAYAELSASKAVGSGDVFRIPAGELDITLD
jgi:hypothetical protein